MTSQKAAVILPPMVWVIAAAGITVLLLVIFGIIFLFSLRANQTSLSSGFKILQESLESMQRNLLLQQKETERLQETKSGTLRLELQEALQNNRKELQQGLMQTSQSLEQRVLAMDTKLDTRLRELTNGVQTKLEANLKEGFVHFEKVQHHLKQAEVQLSNLNHVAQSVTELNNLLKMPHLRGSFGEALLETLLSDLLPGDCFELQYRIIPNSPERVDAVIKYPKTVLPIDSKFPREQVLALFETSDPHRLESAREQLCDVMKTLARQIKEKYIHPEHGTTDMALLFVPSETLYFEILRNPKLCDDLARYKVFTVSPNTLAVTLHGIAISRNYYEMAKGVEKTILEVKKAQQHFENFEKRFDEMGTALGKAQNAFNIASTHLSRYSGAVTRLAGAPASVGEGIITVPPTQAPLLEV